MWRSPILTALLIILPIFSADAKTINFDDVYQIVIFLNNGNLEVIGSDSATEIEIGPPKTIDIPIEKKDDTLKIDLPDNTADYRIVMPRDISLRLEIENGDLHVSEIRGEISAKIRNGSAIFDKTTGLHRIEISNGDIDARIFLTHGPNEFETENGFAHVEILDALIAETSVIANNGEVILDLPSDVSADFVISDRGKIKNMRIGNGGDTVLLKSNTAVVIPGEARQIAIADQDQAILSRLSPKKSWEILPIIDFRRVSGLDLGGRFSVPIDLDKTRRIFGLISYAFSSENWNYAIGLEQSFFDQRELKIGGMSYVFPEAINYGNLSASEAFLDTAIFGSATLDYYNREGMQFWFEQKFTENLDLIFTYTEEKNRNLYKWTDWSLLDRYNRDFGSLISSSEGDLSALLGLPKPKRGNRRITEGDLNSVAFQIRYDSRDVKNYNLIKFRSVPISDHRTTRGWIGDLSIELSPKTVETDLHFSRWQIEIARYQSFTESRFLNVRVIGGFGSQNLPIQKLYYLGGSGNLRGYDFKAFVGERMTLINVEFVQNFSEIFSGVAFADSGQAWFADDGFDLKRQKFCLGFGGMITIESPEDQSASAFLRIDFAKALEADRDPKFTLRLTQIF